MGQVLRVLHIVGDMGQGGMENFIMNLYENIDREKVQFDVVIHRRLENDYVDKLREMGGIVYEIPRLSKKPFSNIKQLYHIVKDNQYKIVIRHTSSAVAALQLLAAKMAGACTICHSHNETDPQLVMHRLGKLIMGAAACENVACSEKAGKWMFGKKSYKVIHNAINISKYAYKQEASERIRGEFQIGGRRVFGNIANFKHSKNHVFLISVYKELLKLDPNAVFFCVGDGELKADIETLVKDCGMGNNVILTGARTDVEDFMSCFDVLIFPSIFEGLPLTLIEAQAAGLPCLISDTITQDVIVTQGLVETESIEEAPAVWAKRAFALADDRKRECQYESIAKAGYDAETVARWYEEYLESLQQRINDKKAGE